MARIFATISPLMTALALISSLSSTTMRPLTLPAMTAWRVSMSPCQLAVFPMLSMPPMEPLPRTVPDTMSWPPVAISPTMVVLSAMTVGDSPSLSDRRRFGSELMEAPITMARSSTWMITMSARTLVTLFAIPLLVLTACSREKSDWRSAQAADSTESYEQFISAHPDSPLVADARERVQQLTEEKDWRAAAS